jgi:signal transduction histidine kinase
VEVRAHIRGDVAVVTVTNPRDPDGSAARGTGFGLDIVRRRLAVSFGHDAAMVTEPGAAFYRVTLTVPAGEPDSEPDSENDA